MDLTLDLRKPRMEMATLARFATPLRWPDILGSGHKNRATKRDPVVLWWSEAVGLAEDAGLLVWEKKTKTWRLTEAGYELVASRAA